MVATTELPGAAGELGDELVCAIELARLAGIEVMKVRGGGDLGVEMKMGDEPVTVADKRASDLIMAALATRFPADPVVSEEAAMPDSILATSNAGRLWLIDPIDGTKDFIKGTDGFA